MNRHTVALWICLLHLGPAACGSGAGSGSLPPTYNDASLADAPAAVVEMTYLPEGEGEPRDHGPGGGSPLALADNRCVGLPLAAYEITGYRFGEGTPGGLHLGEDVAGVHGDPVSSPFRGEVIYARNHPPRAGTPRNWGGLVLIRSLDLSPTVVWVGGHLDSTDLPREGQIVGLGERIGRLATMQQIGYPEHLHSQLASGDLPPAVVAGYAQSTRGWQSFSTWALAVADRCRTGVVTPTCPTGLVSCGASCVDTTRDARHCGGCDVACPAGASCVGSACTAVCASPRTACAGGCVDTTSDARHCGACGRTCAPANATGVCAGGRCGVGACVAGSGDCDRDAANGCETSLQFDAMNCGACGSRCAPPNATGTCVGGACRVAACASGWQDCDGTPSNGCEVASDRDAANCGACGNRCALPQASALCAAGRCAIQACAAGAANCDGSDLNGCEALVASDRFHCGACGRACGATENCLGGVCVPTAECVSGSSRTCATGMAGVCAEGTALCVGGRFGACAPRVTAASSDVCDDARDNDCDGAIDEGCCVSASSPPTLRLPSDRSAYGARDTITFSWTAATNCESRQATLKVRRCVSAGCTDPARDATGPIVYQMAQPAGVTRASVAASSLGTGSFRYVVEQGVPPVAPMFRVFSIGA